MEHGKENRDAMAWADRLEVENPSPGKRKPFWVIWAVFYLILVIGLLVYSVYPVLFHSFVRIATADQYREIDRSELPQVVSDYFDLTDGEFEEIEFAPVLTVIEDGSVPGVKTYLRAYENREDEVMGLAVALASGPSGALSLYSTHVEFSTYFEDGREIASSSWDDVYPFRLTPERQYANLPELDDPRELYRIHAWQVAQAEEGERKFYEPGEAIVHLRWAIRAEMEAEARTGYIELNASTGFHALTWKGAYVAALKQMWPFKGLVEAARDREAKRLLQEVEAGW